VFSRVSRDYSKTMDMRLLALQERFHVTAVRVRMEGRAAIWDRMVIIALARDRITAKTAKRVGVGF